MAGQHFSKRELAILCLDCASSLWSPRSFPPLSSESQPHRNRPPQRLGTAEKNRLFPLFCLNIPQHPRRRRSKRLHLRLREVYASDSFLRQWKARSALGFLIRAANLYASCIGTHS